MDEPANPLIGYECSDGIVTITFNRPQKLNAFDDDMVRQLDMALLRFDMDPQAQVAILRGQGRAFSTGADVHARQLRNRDDLERTGGPAARDAQSSDLLIRSINWKPVISAVHGYAVGMGLGLALECDLVVAEEGTKFQVTETSRGLAASKYWALLDSRGSGSFATEVTLTARFFSAEEALAAGVINRVAPRGTYYEAARELAKAVAKNPPLGVRAGVRTRRWKMEDAEKEATRQSGIGRLYLSEDFAEAAKAFAEKRAAAPFKGR